MKRWLEPPRLSLEGSELGRALRGSRTQQVSAAEIDALARRLEPQLTAARTTAGALAGKSMAGIIWPLLLIATVTAYAALRFAPPQVGAPAPPALREEHPAPPPVEPTPPPVEAAPPPVEAAPPPAEATQPVAPAPARNARRPRRSPPPAPVSSGPEAELSLLTQAQAALDAVPAQSLALAERHAALYPRGVFAQEREILAIEALFKLRRRSSAQARAQQFVAHYPDSPHARRVRPLLEPTTKTSGTDHP